MSRDTTGLRGRGDVNRARDLDGAGLRGRGDVGRTQDLDGAGDSITNVLRSRSRAFVGRPHALAQPRGQDLQASVMSWN